MRKGLTILFTAGALLLGSSVWVLADAADRSIVYKGQLAKDGVRANGTHAFVFRFFSVATGGTQIGTDFTYGSVPVSAGEFSVLLGLIATQHFILILQQSQSRKRSVGS